jgi:hypothetical protein
MSQSLQEAQRGTRNSADRRSGADLGLMNLSMGGVRIWLWWPVWIVSHHPCFVWAWWSL